MWRKLYHCFVVCYRQERQPDDRQMHAWSVRELSFCLCSLSQTNIDPLSIGDARDGRSPTVRSEFSRASSVGCLVLPCACAFNTALLDHRLWNRWQGITLSPTLITNIPGQASTTHSTVCVFASPLKSPPLSLQRHHQIRRHTWVKLTEQLIPIKQTYAPVLQWVCTRLFKWSRQLWWVDVWGLALTGWMTSEPDRSELRAGTVRCSPYLVPQIGANNWTIN